MTIFHLPYIPLRNLNQWIFININKEFNRYRILKFKIGNKALFFLISYLEINTRRRFWFKETDEKISARTVMRTLGVDNNNNNNIQRNIEIIEIPNNCSVLFAEKEFLTYIL